jgi:ubiquinone/menaquinone biosynthesis C-methylase UbiE
MTNAQDIKNVVKDKYADIARQANKGMNEGCGCGCSCEPGTDEYNVFQDAYINIEGYVPDADLGLGCGLPTQYAAINKGDVVVDLGSGAGNDVFVARSIVGKDGKVIGIDMTEEMIDKAISNNQKLGYHNVEFKLADIENMPIDSDSVNVVVSNCVLNLVPDKRKAYTEIYRILKPGAHFCISDVVTKGELTASLKKSAELYAGCVAGALELDDYLEVIKEANFRDVEINKLKQIELPDELLRNYLSEEELTEVKNSDLGIYSVTISGYKR